MSISKLIAGNLTVTLGISMRSGYTIWGTALIFYLVFLGWHENWRGPLTESEIATFTARAQSINGLSAEQLAHFEMFMRDDDGGEFFMVNLVGFTEGPQVIPKLAQRSMRASWCRAISDPLPSKFLPAPDTRHFLPARCRAILRRGALRQIPAGILQT